MQPDGETQEAMQLWAKFAASGSIADYLQYCQQKRD